MSGTRPDESPRRAKPSATWMIRLAESDGRVADTSGDLVDTARRGIETFVRVGDASVHVDYVVAAADDTSARACSMETATSGTSLADGGSARAIARFSRKAGVSCRAAE